MRNAFRQAAMRLGVRSERALHDLRVRLIGHIHQLSLADHNDERRGGLVARVTSEGGRTIHPRRRAGARILEKEPT